MRSAMRLSAISRSAARFFFVKKFESATQLRSGTYTFPALSRSIKSSGSISISSTESARSNTESGMRSATRTCVMAEILSFNPSRCWTFTVVNTLMPARSSSSTSW